MVYVLMALHKNILLKRMYLAVIAMLMPWRTVFPLHYVEKIIIKNEVCSFMSPVSPSS